MKPWCFASLGGKKISPGFNIGHGRAADSVDGHDRGAKWHVHWYVYPLLHWMEILTDMACLEQSSFDIAYVTEIDPLWQDDTLTALINPEVALFANPLAQTACAADCGPATGKLPLHRPEEHTSELQSLMRISYAVFCLKKKKNRQQSK